MRLPGFSAGRAAALALALSAAAFVWGYAREEQPEDPFDSADPEAQLPAATTRAGPSAWETATVKRATAGLPGYPNAAPRAIGEDFLGANAPIAAAWFTTPDSPEQVFSFYRAAFLKNGLPVLEAHPTPDSGYVGYFNPASMNLELISVLRQGQQTVVFPSSGNASQLLEGGATLPPTLPRPERVGKVSAFRLRHEGRVDHSLVVELPQTELTSAVGFYRSALGSGEWRLELDEPLEAGRRFEASAPAGRLSVFLRERPSTHSVDAFLRFVEST